MRVITCPSCHGEGGIKDVILDDGSGPTEPCGYCRETGYVTPLMWGWLMQWRKNCSWDPSDAKVKEEQSQFEELQIRIQQRKAARQKALKELYGKE